MCLLGFRLVVILCVVLAACSEATNGTGMISQRIGEAARKPDTKEIDVSKLTTFGWDRFYFFNAGTPRDEICKFMGANRTNCGRVIRYQVVPEGSVTMLFAMKGRLTHTELHDLENGKLDLVPKEDGFAKEDLVFRVRRSPSSNGKDSILLEPK
jgi:hypothetical protein